MEPGLLEARDLCKHFQVRGGLLPGRGGKWLKAVDGVSFQVRNGQTFGLVGESGCGKTTLARLVLLVERPTSGDVRYCGRSVLDLAGEKLRGYRAAVQAVFQDPHSCMDPRMRVGSIIAEPIRANRLLSGERLRDRVRELLTWVGLDPNADSLYPHEFSGGQRQRIAIARALAPDPRVVVLDEPVSSLDISIRAQIMNLLVDLQEKLGIAYLLIAHNLATVRYMSNRVGVMYLGKLVEAADCEELYRNPLHPYTRALIAAALPSHPRYRGQRELLPGEVASALDPPEGCSFNPRCSSARPICRQTEPAMRDLSGHAVSCHLHG